MPLYQAIVLALVQAFTEFLPVSSTAHLTLFPWLLGWQDPGLAFDVALHAGTLVAVLLYFFKDWITLTLCGLGLKYPSSATPEEVGCDLIVVGTHGRTGLSRLLMGSVAENVLTRATCPVLVVKATQQAAAAGAERPKAEMTTVV